VNENAFAKILGRQPTDAERARLQRIRDALDLRENDAFWYILMALESYDSMYREYPRILTETTTRAVKDARAAFAAAAALESAKAQRMLSEQVSRTSVAIAKKLAERSMGVERVTMMLAAVVSFGAVCTVSGYCLVGAERPFWVAGHTQSGQMRIVTTLLGVPAGWMAFLLLLPAAVQTASRGWKLTQELGAARRQQIYGWALIAVAGLGTVGCLIALVRIL
jgi:hypothetical protein